MKRFSRFACVSLAALFAMVAFGPSVTKGQSYKIDPAHCAVNFRISHLGISYVTGRFNAVQGEFSIDAADPTKSSFSVTIQTESIDTANKQRDDHLRSPDFLNARQFPIIRFQSTKVSKTDKGYEVTGDFTLHGQTKSITFELEDGGTAEFPPGVHRIGFTTSLKIKRSDFGIDGMLQAIGDEVFIFISFEGVRQ